jgi:GntR family transcriptional regulator, transcriptional repressor for pyruvate dehydrogenase complex
VPVARSAQWTQITLALCGQITDGVYPVKSRVPSYRTLAGEYGVSLTPVRRAYGHLQDVGVLEGQERHGVVVVRLPEPEDLPGGVALRDEVAALRLELTSVRAEVAELRAVVASFAELRAE